MAYKILWYSIPALHDNTNGAAIHSKIMLEALARRGIEIKVLNALVGDDVRGLEVFNRIGAQIGDTKERKVLQFTDSGVEYFVAKTQGHTEPTILVSDQNLVFDLYQQLLEKFQPDLIMGYSGDVFSTVLRREAQARGIPVVYVLHNGYHRGYGFVACDLVVAPSQICAQSYFEQDGIDVKAIGQFIDSERVLAQHRDQKDKIQYVTLVNPTPAKGIAIFVKLHEVFAQKHPEVPFLVVKSVGDYHQTLRQLHYPDSTPFVAEGQPCSADSIQVAEHTDEPRLIYDVSRVVVTPSLCFESWGCVASEAVMNGIPVLSTNSGGLPEAISGGGILLEPPESTKKDNLCLPTDEEIAPWVEALERCLNEDWTEACDQATEALGLEHSIDRLLGYIEPLMQKAQKQRDVFGQSAYFSDLCMKRRKQAFEQKAAQQQQAQAQAQHQGLAAAGVTRIAVRNQVKTGSKSSKKNRGGAKSKRKK